MRLGTTILLATTLAAAQANSAGTAPTMAPSAAVEKQVMIPAGTKVPLLLKHAISTKGAQEGDPVYAETNFPVVLNDHVLIPAGTYVQGKITHVQRAGRIKGRAEVQMHFTTLIYPSGYTVMLPGSLENVPGADKTKMKGQEGTIQQDGQTGEKIGTVASTAGTGAVIGGLSHGGKGALVGGGIGGAVGTAIALLTKGNDVRLESGTTVEMVIQREVALDSSRIPSTTAKN